jgi:CDP-glycerol glycerophosphotransferase
MLRDELRKRATWLAHAVYGVVPKRRTAVVSGWPDYCDDVLALEAALRATRLSRVVILASSQAEARARVGYPELAGTTLVVGKRSIRGVFHALTAKYVFFTHSFTVQRFPASVVSVNLWHGMPVKRVGWMTESGPLLPVAKYCVATSPFWAVVVQESLRPLVGTLATGLPRNDRLLLGERGVLARLGCGPGAGSKTSGTRMIAWLPTYRVNLDSQDKRVHCSQVLGLADDALGRFNSMLERHNALLVVKPHPLAATEDTPESSRVRYVTDEWLRDEGLTLHELLGESCALVTDVSSVYVDYLVLDRPIVHYFPDIEAYGESRGFSITPIEDYVAGPITADPDALVAALSAILQGKDTHARQRRRVRALFHEHVDGSASARLLHELGLEPGVMPRGWLRAPRS